MLQREVIIDFLPLCNSWIDIPAISNEEISVDHVSDESFRYPFLFMIRRPQNSCGLAASWVKLQAAVSLGIAVATPSDSNCFGKKDDKDKGQEDFSFKKFQLVMENFVAKTPKNGSELQAHMNEFLASGQGGQISWGFMMGACSGYTLKKVSKVASLMLGVAFISMQCASYSGYVNVDYKKLKRTFTDTLDFDKVIAYPCYVEKWSINLVHLFRMERLIQRI
jgi:uncharacterized membrane protein (Fun14 family)